MKKSKKFIPNLKKTLVFFIITCILLTIFLLISNYNNHALSEKSSSLSDCLEVENSESCLEQTAIILIKKEGVEKTLEQLIQVVETDSSLTDNCHAVMHVLGKVSYENYKQIGVFDPIPNMNICSYGFYHGLMETMFGANGGYQEAAEFCRMVDKKSQEINITGECFHGIGHGVTEDHEIEIIDNIPEFIQESLNTCKLATGDESEQHECSTGVFNGLANMYLAEDKSLVIEKKDPLWMCHDLEDLFIRACYGLMSRIILKSAEGIMPEALRLASSTIDDIYLNTVIENIMVMTIFNSSSDEHIKNMLTECLENAVGFEQQCVRGIAIAVFQNGSPGVEYKKALDFCNNFDISIETNNSCFATVYSYFPKTYTKQIISEICFTLKEKEHECKKVALNEV